MTGLMIASTLLCDFRASMIRAAAPLPVHDVMVRCRSGAPSVGPLRIAVLGTSLTHDYTWPDAVVTELGERSGRDVDLVRVARSGATSDWGRTAVASRPYLSDVDVVLVEFLANDSDLLDRMTVRRSRENHLAMIRSIRGRESRCGGPAIVLMTMSPAHGARGVLRLRLPAFEAMYAGLATDFRVGLLDIRSRWDPRQRFDDGLHPSDGQADAVIPPAVTDYLDALLSA